MKQWVLIFGVALITLATMSEADVVKNMLLFGDSYFDTGAGNALATSLSQPLPNPTPPYFGQRHSDGPIWLDYVSWKLELPFDNYAICGSETGTGNTSNSLLGGINNQILRREANLSNISSSTLAMLDGGGNDYLALLFAGGPFTPAAIAGVAETALTNQANNLMQIIGMGSKKTVIWNLGDLGRLPLFSDPTLGLTALAPLFTGGSVAYNAGLEEVVQKINKQAPDHQQVYIFDVFNVFNQIECLFSAEGVNVSEHTLTAFPDGGTIVTGPPPYNLVFYDQVHSTTNAYRVLSTYIAGYIDTLYNGPRFIGVEEDLAFEGATAFRDTLDNHFRGLHLQHYAFLDEWNPCRRNCSCFQFYVDINAKWGATETRNGTYGMDYNNQVYLMGADYFWSDCWTLGLSFAYEANHGRVDDHHGSIDLDDCIPSIYLTYYGDCYFLDASFSYHIQNFKEIKRRIPFYNKTAKACTEGNGQELNVNLGRVYECGCFIAMPLIGFDITHINIHGYKEHQAGFLNLNVNHLHNNSLIAKLGGQLFWNQCQCSISPFGELYWEHEFLRSEHTIGPRFRSSRDGAKIYNRLSSPCRDVMKFAVGVNTEFSRCLNGNISYEGETNFKNYNNSIKVQIASMF